jgi:large subunit ribosomal protein LP2
MRYVAAYMLAVIGGNGQPKKEDIKTILSSVGIDAEDDRIDIVLKQMKGKNMESVLEEGELHI